MPVKTTNNFTENYTVQTFIDCITLQSSRFSLLWMFVNPLQIALPNNTKGCFYMKEIFDNYSKL